MWFAGCNATIFRSQKPIEQIMNLQLHFVAFQLEEVKEYVSELPRSMLLRCCVASSVLCSLMISGWVKGVHLEDRYKAPQRGCTTPFYWCGAMQCTTSKKNCTTNARIVKNSVSKVQFLKATLHFVAAQEHFKFLKNIFLVQENEPSKEQ